MAECSVEDIAKAAKAAFESSQLLPSDVRSQALERIAERLEANKAPILAANNEDMQVQSLSCSIPMTDIRKGGPSRGRCRADVKCNAEASRPRQRR